MADENQAQGITNGDNTNYNAPQESQDKGKGKDNVDLNDMHGWLLTVATLLVAIAFQAAMQPPAWMPKDWGRAIWDAKLHRALSHHEKVQAGRAVAYQILNAVTFSAALSIVMRLLVEVKWPRRVRLPMELSVTFIVHLLVFVIAGSFVLGVTSDWVATAVLFVVMVCVALLERYFAIFAKKLN